MKLFNVVKTTSRDWKILGGKLATRIVKDTEKGISQDEDGKKFPNYTDNYSILKSSGKAGLKGVSKDRQVSPPNLRLTGKMLDSIKAQRPKATSVEILYADGEKVIGHAKKRGNKAKRNIYGLNENNQQFVEDYLTKKIEDNISRYVAKDIIIDMDI